MPAARQISFSCARRGCQKDEGHHHLVGMLLRLAIDRVNQLHGALGVLALVLVRLNPDGEELRTKIASLRFGEIEMSRIARWNICQVEIFVEKTLRGVGVCVNNERGFVDSFCGHGFLRLGGLICGRLRSLCVAQAASRKLR